MLSSNDQLRVALAGGGTGGHIYPNLAVLDVLRERLGSERVCPLLLVSERAIDRSIAEAEGVPAAAIPAAPLGMRPRALARLVLGWGGAVRAARAALREHRSDLVLATGGFVSAPVMMAARAERVPLVLLNLDAVAGKANRWIARHACVRLSSADGEGVPGDWERIRPVVRRAAMPRGSAADCRRTLGLHTDRQTLLITGGSQGATSINLLLLELLAHHPEAFEGWQVLHQCGDKGTDALAAAYAGAGIEARCVDYLTDMASAWGAADLAVSRCGAGSVAEIWSARVPSVLLPYPYHRDQHQAANARPLVESGAAIIETDQIHAEANLDRAGRTILDLLQNSERREAMRGAFESLGPTDGGEIVADRILMLASMS